MTPNRVDELGSLSADNRLALSNEFLAMDSPTDSGNGPQRSGEEPQLVLVDQAVETGNAKAPRRRSD